MPYYEKDAEFIAGLESELAAVRLPLLRAREFIAILRVSRDYRECVDKRFSRRKGGA